MAKKNLNKLPSNPYLPRKTNKIPIRKRFLIICEGETEETYFKNFQQLGKEKKTATIAINIENAKAVGITVVKKAIKLKKDDSDYKDDEVWCVFDRDAQKENNNQQNFNTAIQLADKSQINLAISNDAFELWFLLHYQYYCSQTHRNNLHKSLTSKSGEKYEKNTDIYHKLEDKQKEAIKNAKILWLTHCNDRGFDNEQLSFSEKQTIHNINPSTTVYQLVEKLREVIGI